MRFAVALLLATLVQVSFAGLISKLPGLAGEPNFKQYAGFVDVDASHGRQLFYWFVESQNRPATDPVIFWVCIAS